MYASGSIKNGLKCLPLLFSFGIRLVLSAVSDYFAAMFTNDVREAKQEEVKMEGVDPDALKDLVLYAYTGKFSTSFHSLQVFPRALA